MSLPPNDPETRKSHSTPGSAENPDETIHPGHSAKSSMETTKAKEITSIILWIVWAIISPAILFLLIRSPVGLAILFLVYIGGGAVILLIFIALLVTGGAIGAKLKGNASGLFFVLIPFVMSFLYMSVYGEFFSFQAKRKSADSRAKAILEKQEAILIDGLYTESMDLRNALYGMIVVRQFPLVEGDVAGAGWLFDLAQDRQAIHRKSEGKKYFSLSLGPLDSPDCFPWKSESDNLARGASFQPRTCLMVVFDSVLKSDTRLHAKLGQSENSKRYWEISRIGEDTPMVVIPFVAEPQYRPHYRYSHESNSFVELMKKLEPRAISLAADGKPYRLKGWRPKPAHLKHGKLTVTASVRRADEAWGARIDKKESWDERWEHVYQRAQELGRPVALDDSLIVFPDSHEIYGNSQEYSKLLVTNHCFFTVKNESYAKEQEISMTGWDFPGENSFDISVKPESLPEEISTITANNPNDRCNFYVDGIKTTDSELMAIGRYLSCKGAPKNNYEWVVPLEQLSSLGCMSL